MTLHSSTNLRHRVNKLYLPKTKALLPIFEVISNSVHAIDELNKSGKEQVDGKITIDVVRRGELKALLDVENIEEYPIVAFRINDNGIGLNDANINSFAEFDSEKKAKIGGKGVGRLFCLKAFEKLIVESVYENGASLFRRTFEYKKTKDGFEKHANDPIDNGIQGTTILLDNFSETYEKNVPRGIVDIGREIITHFQLYYIQKNEPEIVIRNQDNSEVNLTNLFEREFSQKILKDEFDIQEEAFKVFVSKSYKAKSHRIHYCAHQRTVKDEGISKYLGDLRFALEDDESKQVYFFQFFVVGEFLDKYVNEARSGFNFSLEEDDETRDISLGQIRKETIVKIEGLLSNILERVREKKMGEYIPIVESDYPNYKTVINYNRHEVERLPVGLTKNELDLKLYEIESNWRIKVKSQGIELLEKKKDITTLEEYKTLYTDYLSEFNSIGQSDLARYIVHRKAVIDLLDKLIELNEDGSFANEDIVHSLFFPIKKNGNTVLSEKQNLWLLDERLTFNSLLASDKLFKQIDELTSDSSRRMDIIIRQNEVFDNASLFSEEKYPHESFTVIEFKKPERDDYVHGDRKKDPVKQVRMYIEEIVNGKKKVKGKANLASPNTPFYCYIVADITASLKYILDFENFDPTPDGLGYFKFYDTKTSKAYIEVMPFKKIIRDAKQRNKILFDQLKIS